MDVRRTGTWLVAIGGATMAGGLIADAVRHADDPSLAAREGIFDLSGVPHALFFGGIAVAVLGLLTVLFGERLYRTDARVTVGRRLAQVAAPLGVVALLVGCTAAAADSYLGDPPEAEDAEHSHEGDAATASDGHTHDASSDTSAGTDDASHEAAVVPPKPYDPTQPIDLSGVEGVTPEQQARAENLIAISLLRLPKFADPAVAEANGYRTIGDAATGDEHYVNTALFNDGRMLDPDYPESLVYQPDGAGGKKLAAAMYMAEPGITLDNTPDIGGKLTQWHIHNNLCFTAQGRVGGLTNADGSCRAPLVKGPETPMIHVWIQPHRCGPFAALEGVGGGQIKEGETKLCDHAHGAGA